MLKVAILLTCLVSISGCVTADPILDEETAIAISEEMTLAIKNGDVSVFEKYVYPGSKLIMDWDPSAGTSQTEIPYDAYIGLVKMFIGLMQDAELHNELISVSVDEAKNQATVEEKTTTVVDMMGVKVKEVTIGRTTYGVVDGEIKVLSSEGQKILMERVE